MILRIVKIVWRSLLLILLFFCLAFWVSKAHSCISAYARSGLPGLRSALYHGVPASLNPEDVNRERWDVVIISLLVMLLLSILAWYGNRNFIKQICRNLGTR